MRSWNTKMECHASMTFLATLLCYCHSAMHISLKNNAPKKQTMRLDPASRLARQDEWQIAKVPVR